MDNNPSSSRGGTVVVHSSGTREWLDEDGKRHREGDQPAIIYADGSQMWYSHGKLHRSNGLPAVIMANGRQEWWNNGEQIRVMLL